jgi:hypothetical protein
MKKLLSVAICTIIFFSCTKDETSVFNRPLLHEKFNGKYELLSAISEKAVDLNNDGKASTELLNENSMILFSTVEIRIPQKDDLFIEDNEFVFSEFWPTENGQRLKDKDVITVYRTKIYSGNYDIYGNVLIGEFMDDLKYGTFITDINDDGKNTLIELKSLEFLDDDKIEVTAVRKLYTMSGWTVTKIKSLYKKYTTRT